MTGDASAAARHRHALLFVVLLGVLYDVSPLFTVVAALVLQLAACPLLWSLRTPARSTG